MKGLAKLFFVCGGGGGGEGLGFAFSNFSKSYFSMIYRQLKLYSNFCAI